MKKNYLAVILVILVIALGYFWLQLRQAESDNADLADQISVLDLALEDIPISNITELEAELAELEEVLAKRQNDFAAPVNTTTVVERVIQIGEQHEVSVIPLSTRDWQTETVSGYDFKVFRLTVAVNGKYSSLLSFLQGLETINVGVITVEDVSLVVTASNSNTDQMGINAEVQLAVYTGASGEE